MLIIGLGFFVTSWILSHRRISDVDTNEEIVSDVPKTLNVPGRISTPRREKEPVVKEETQTNDEIQKISDAVDYNQDEEWLEEFPDSLTEEKNEDASQAEENTAMYAAVKEPFQQLHNLYTQLDSHEEKFEDVKETFRIVNGRIVMDEIWEWMDERDTLRRQIAETAKEAQRIAPNAIEVIKKYIGNPGRFPGPNLIRYDINISRQKLETSWGKIPADIEPYFPSEHRFVVVPEDENFSYLEWYRENERERLARQDSQNR